MLSNKSGRKYCSTADFHEQTGDLAKGMLLYSNRKPITKRGFYWLLISIASNWSSTSDRVDKVKTDKLPLNERVYWTLDHEATILSYAENPRVKQGWMKAEKPWQFLSCCMELKKLREYQATLTAEQQADDSILYGYTSGIVVYVDG